MPRLILDPSWQATPKTRIPMHSIVLGDGYGINTDLYQVIDEDYQIERSGLTGSQLQVLLLQIKQFSGVDEFDWSPDINRYPLKKYRMPSHSVTKIGLGYYKISAPLKRVGISLPGQSILIPPAIITSVTIAPFSIVSGHFASVSATVLGTGPFMPTVTWSLLPSSTAIGTFSIVNGNTVYTAPAGSTGLISILLATSTQNNTIIGQRSVTVQAPQVYYMNTSSTTLVPGISFILNAVLYGIGDFNPNVTWSVISGSVIGTISTQNGQTIYTVPQSNQYRFSILRAVSVQTPSIQQTVSVNIWP